MLTENNGSGKQYCILFYKYHPLTDNTEVLETYRQATEKLCTSLQLTGRVLIGLSDDGEGINGTLAGTKDDLDAYVDCMLGRNVAKVKLDQRRTDTAVAFRDASKQFFAKLDLPELFLNSPNDFKWSSWSKSSADKKKSNTAEDVENWFPDLNIKIVKEIISSGGAFGDISTQDTSVGYLTPREWHKEIQSLMNKKNKISCSGGGGLESKEEDEETILIDVRNHKECQIGSFAPGISIDPQTKTFAQFPKWVKENSTESDIVPSKESTSNAPSSSILNNKRILMYCTGGIRCEKASAYIRQMVPENKGIFHLKGGIHKYLEEFGQDALNTNDNDADGGKEGDDGDECLFVGKNFVFDRRGALDAKGHGIEEKAGGGEDASLVKANGSIIGKCQYCSDPYDVFHAENVCTVCREPILVCDKCQLNLCQTQQSLRGLTSSDGMEDDSKKESSCRAEYHCQDHFHLSTCYFTSLYGFERNELRKQVEELQLHSKELEGLGKKGKQRRRTLRKQIDKIEASMKDESCDVKGESTGLQSGMLCRHCGSPACSSNCWGFHGGNTRMVNRNKKNEGSGNNESANTVKPKKHKQRSRVPSNQRPAKRLKHQNDIAEIEALQLCSPPSQHRDDANGLRVPPPVIRLLRSGVKGRWCGKTVHWVMNNEFGDWQGLPQAEREERLEKLIAGGLIRINGVSISKIFESSASSSSPHPAEASDIVLRNMDTIERIVHWHEPPISVPSKISLAKHTLPESILPTNSESAAIPLLYCIDKPSTVPIYPAGPYYANSLLLMVEAQEGLPPKTLIPLHRIDRATSGVLLCANMSSVARVIQGRITSSTSEDEKNPPTKKLYLARVRGRFPGGMPLESPTLPKECESIASVDWCGNGNDVLEVNAPIAVQLSTNKSSLPNEDENLSNTMMHRTVRGDGKNSISRFKFISYDPNTNQSLVSCCPVTGRGHQLRVHLDLIGYPIHNDVEYGGRVAAESRKEQESISAQSMLNVSLATTECRHDKAVSVDEVKSAVELCICCRGGLEGIKSCFNSGQLLGCGHAIDLHAYKYCISFPNKSKEEKSQDISCGENEHFDEEATPIEFAAGLPLWAFSFAGLAPSNSLTWLN